MGIQYQWVDEVHKNIVHVMFMPGWTWADYVATKPGIDRLIRSVNHFVYLISDHSDTVVLPGGVALAFSHMPRVCDTMPPNVAGVVTVSGSRSLRLVLSSIQRLTTNQRFRHLEFASTLADALHLIHRHQQGALNG